MAYVTLAAVGHTVGKAKLKRGYPPIRFKRVGILNVGGSTLREIHCGASRSDFSRSGFSIGLISRSAAPLCGGHTGLLIERDLD